MPERRMKDTGRPAREQRQPVVINGWQGAAGLEKLMARVIPSYTTPTETLERKEKERDMQRKRLEQLRNFSTKPNQGYRQDNSSQERPMAPVSRPRAEKIGAENTKQPRQQQIRKSNVSDVDTSSFTGYAAMFCADIVKPSKE